MTTTLSVRLDIQTKKRLEALAKRARRSKSFLAAEAIAAFVDAESWQLDEIQMGLHELDGDVTVDFYLVPKVGLVKVEINATNGGNTFELSEFKEAKK